MKHDIKAKLNNIVKDNNMEYAIMHKPQYSLKEMLVYKTVKELKLLCKVTQLTGYSTLKKDQLIKELYENIIDRDFFEWMILALNDENWGIFRELVKKKANKNIMILGQECISLIVMGLLSIYYYEGDLYYIVPTEHRKNFKELEKTGIVNYKGIICSINKFAMAATNLYGIIEINEFIVIFNRYNESELPIDIVVPILEDHIKDDVGYIIIDGYLADDVLQGDIDAIHSLAEIVKSKPRYMPSFEEFLMYSDYEYTDATEYLDALYDYFVDSKLCEDDESIEGLVGEIYELCRMEYSINDCFVLVQDAGIVFESKQQAEDVTRLMVELHNNCRIWSNKGYTPLELRNRPVAKNLTVLSNKTKVGRNDPCPCGSGKKYKKCCGRG